MPIRRIDLEPYRGTVHNLEVEGHNSYVGSFVVHNSAGVNLPARASHQQLRTLRSRLWQIPDKCARVQAILPASGCAGDPGRRVSNSNWPDCEGPNWRTRVVHG